MCRYGAFVNECKFKTLKFGGDIYMVKQQSGFTLIELIAVMVILGILAAVAVPKFIDLSDAAEGAAIASIAGNLESASALNHAVDIANEAGLTSDPVISIANCTDAEDLLESGLDVKYSITANAVGDKVSVSCTIGAYPVSGGAADTSVPAIASATFQLIGAQ